MLVYSPMDKTKLTCADSQTSIPQGASYEC